MPGYASPIFGIRIAGAPVGEPKIENDKGIAGTTETSTEPLVGPDGPQTVPVPQEPAQKSYCASIHTGPVSVLPPDLVSGVLALEKTLAMPVWLIVQNGGGKFSALDETLVEALLAARAHLPENKPIALLIDSMGGFAKSAYQLATIVRKHCGGFTAVVPRGAKSAATLLTLGADSVVLGKYAELGPLDAQFIDPDREESVSALDEVQALERLHAFALEAVDRTMFLMTPRTGKKVETLLPVVMRFITDMVRPLFEKIDAVHYTQMSRALKVAEEYAIRLLQTKYPPEKARQIARHLVEYYPEHGFVIDAEEASRFDLATLMATPEQQSAIDLMFPHLGSLTAFGCLKGV